MFKYGNNHNLILTNKNQTTYLTHITITNINDKIKIKRKVKRC